MLRSSVCYEIERFMSPAFGAELLALSSELRIYYPLDGFLLAGYQKTIRKDGFDGCSEHL